MQYLYHNRLHNLTRLHYVVQRSTRSHDLWTALLDEQLWEVEEVELLYLLVTSLESRLEWVVAVDWPACPH